MAAHVSRETPFFTSLFCFVLVLPDFKARCIPGVEGCSGKRNSSSMSGRRNRFSRSQRSTFPCTRREVMAMMRSRCAASDGALTICSPRLARSRQSEERGEREAAVMPSYLLRLIIVRVLLFFPGCESYRTSSINFRIRKIPRPPILRSERSAFKSGIGISEGSNGSP